MADDDQTIVVKSDVFERPDGRWDWTVRAVDTPHMAVGEGESPTDCHRQISAWLTEQFGVPDEQMMVLRLSADVRNE